MCSYHLYQICISWHKDREQQYTWFKKKRGKKKQTNLRPASWCNQSVSWTVISRSRGTSCARARDTDLGNTFQFGEDETCVTIFPILSALGYLASPSYGDKQQRDSQKLWVWLHGTVHTAASLCFGGFNGITVNLEMTHGCNNCSYSHPSTPLPAKQPYLCTQLFFLFNICYGNTNSHDILVSFKDAFALFLLWVWRIWLFWNVRSGSDCTAPSITLRCFTHAHIYIYMYLYEI